MNDKALVVKANQLIEAKYKLSLSEQKIVLHYISKIKRSDDDFQEYSFSVNEIKDFLGWSEETKGLYSKLYNLSEQFFSKPLGIRDENGKRFVFFNWFSKIQFNGTELILRSDPDLKPYLLQLKSHFTKYQLKNVIRLKSIYAIRIYELTKQFEGIGCRRFELDNLKDILGVAGKYSRIQNFKQKVLNKAVKEINTHTDIHIDYTLHKTGRTVTAVEFCIEKQSSDPSAPQKKSPPLAIINLIPEEHRKPCRDICQRIFDQDGTDGLKFYIEKANGRKKAKNSSYGGYLKSIFNLDVYGDMREALEAQAKAEAESKRLKKEVLEAQRRQQVKRESEQAKLKRQNDMLADIETNDPDRWIKLKKQAAGNLGMKNPKRPGPGGKTKIRFEITRILEHD